MPYHGITSVYIQSHVWFVSAVMRACSHNVVWSHMEAEWIFLYIYSQRGGVIVRKHLDALFDHEVIVADVCNVTMKCC